MANDEPSHLWAHFPSMSRVHYYYLMGEETDLAQGLMDPNDISHHYNDESISGLNIEHDNIYIYICSNFACQIYVKMNGGNQMLI